MELSIIIIGFFMLLMFGIPIFFAVGISSFVYLLILDIPIIIVVQRMVSGVNSFTLLGAPLFILAGVIMSRSGTIMRLVMLSDALVGHITGGLGQVNILASVIFAGMSGSSTSDASGLGALIIPAMIEDGYPPNFSAAVTAASSTIGPIIPPSVPFVVYGSMAQISIGRLFLGGAIPGLIMGILLMIIVYLQCRFYHIRIKETKSSIFSLSKLVDTLKLSIWDLMIPILIIGGILTGTFTPTEAASIVVVYALFIGLYVHKDIKYKDLPSIFLKAGSLIGMIMIIVAACTLFGWILVREQAGEIIINAMFGITHNIYVLRLLLMLTLLILGCFIETISLIILIVPILLKITPFLGMDAIHLGVLTVLVTMIGIITPPVGLCMYIVNMWAGINTVDYLRAIWPHLITLFIAALIVAMFPSTVLWLPNLLMGR